MVVTCERCHTQFQLDDARVPETGVFVRCSRCKHAFVVQRPAAEPEEVIHAVAERAASEGTTPDVTRDLPADRSASPFEEESSSPFEEESDWEFNDDSGLDDDAPELADDPPPRAPASSPRAPEAPPVSSAPRSELVAAPRPAPEPELDDELGSPGEWDIFDDDPEPPAREVLAPAATPLPRASAPMPLRRSEDLAPEDSAENVWLQRAATAAGWLATAALCAFGFARGLAPSTPNGVAPLLAAPDIGLEDVRARWVDNANLGRVFVVSGALHNEREAFVPMPGFELVLLDATGREVGAGVPLGAPRSASLLREGDAAELKASSLPHRPLRPGESVPFEGVSWPLPRDAASFAFRPAGGAS